MSHPLADEVPVLCRLGSHLPAFEPIWNHGYFFARCARCERDIVKAALGRWHVPHGYRVVWRSRHPESMAMTDLVDEQSIRPGAGDAAEAAEVSSAIAGGIVEKTEPCHLFEPEPAAAAMPQPDPGKQPDSVAQPEPVTQPRPVAQPAPAEGILSDPVELVPAWDCAEPDAEPVVDVQSPAASPRASSIPDFMVDDAA
jgi:hypothetical protein